MAECLDAAQKERFQALLTTEPYAEVRPLMITTYERGVAEGILRGERASTLRLLEAKFGELSPQVKARVEALSPEELRQLQLDLLRARSLKKLRLED